MLNELTQLLFEL